MKAALRVERLIHKSVFFGSPTIKTTAQALDVELFIIRVNRNSSTLIHLYFVIYTSDALFYTLRGLLRNQTDRYWFNSQPNESLRAPVMLY